MAPNGTDEIRVVLVGRAGCGRSSLGNLLLQEKRFPVGISGSSVTGECQVEKKNLQDGRSLVVVDTPPLTPNNMNNSAIRKCLDLTCPGPHVFILVIRIGRFTQEVLQCIDNFRDIFGDQVMNFTMVAFSEKDTLDFDGETMEEYLSDCPPKMKQTLTACGSRFIGVNNRSKVPADRSGVMAKIYQLVEKRGGSFYTDSYGGRATQPGMTTGPHGGRDTQVTIGIPTQRGYNQGIRDRSLTGKENQNLLYRNEMTQEQKRKRTIAVCVAAVVIVIIIIIILASTLR